MNAAPIKTEANSTRASQAPTFSLILATYGRVEDVGRLVDSLVAQTCQDFELIVVDQNLDNRILPFLQRGRDAGLRVIHLRLDRPNLSAARNRGLEAASGEWVAFPDDDCWYEPQTLAKVASVILSQPDMDGFVVRWEEQYVACGRVSDNGRLSLHAWRRFRGGDASSITLVLRLDKVMEQGGFDERIGVGQFFGGGEEIDLLLRLMAVGGRLERLNEAVVHHAYGPREGATAAQERARARGTGALYAKHRLPTFVILRGLIAPPIHALFGRKRYDALMYGLAVSFGRWEGWRQWPDS